MTVVIGAIELVVTAPFAVMTVAVIVTVLLDWPFAGPAAVAVAIAAAGPFTLAQ